MSKPARLLAVGGLLGAWPTMANALEYCVTCEGPPAMYRCVIKDTEDGPGKNPSVSLFCTTQMAARGHHQSCSVSRGAPFPCPGLTAILEEPAELPTLAAPPPDAPLPERESATEPATLPPAPKDAPAQKASSKVPRTVEELAGQTVKSSKDGLQQAGEAIGGTAKKAGEQIGNAGSAIGNAATTTWNCLTSLFSKCSSTPSSEPPPPPPDGPPPE